MHHLFDHLMLSRLQFAISTGFHILFPTLTIGLGLFLVVLEALWLRTGNLAYYRHFRFWSKLFALNFAVGVVTGIPLEFQFGTNWGPFSAAVGNYFGQVLGFEGSIAFMLEAAFLYLMLSGWNKLGPKMHFTATIMVFLGASFSAFWILVASSWMQTPAGGHMENGVFVVDNYLAALFTPDLYFASTHMYVACLEVSLFVVGAISCFYILKKRHTAFFLTSLKLVTIAAVAIAPLQAVLGDGLGLIMAKYQPAKMAAVESNWDSNPPGTGAPWNLVAWPDAEQERNVFSIQIPYVLSLLVTRTLTGVAPALKDFPKEDRPPIVLPFYAFRGMVGVGFAMIGVMAWTLYAWRRGRLSAATAPDQKALLWTWIAMAGLAYLAVDLGWITREVGRQPWIVYGLIRTSQGVSNLPAGAVGASLAAFVAAYAILFSVFVYYVRRLLRQGPDMDQTPPPGHGAR